jgi:hypothetical protein
VVERVVALLAQHPKGLRSEQIQAKLGFAAREMPRPLADALAAHRIIRRGVKRATTYFAAPAKVAKARPAPKAKAKARHEPASRKKARPSSRAARTRGAKTKRPSKAPKKAVTPSTKPAPNGAPVTAAAGAGAPS